MNTIDQRIMIPSSPSFIWGLIGHMADNPKWQMNCLNVSFLTTNHEGQGMRYRATNNKGREYVVEITAWYENVGYAYQIVDGVSFKSNRGKIRLQETAEGTIVQWLFEYELSGMFSGLKNSLGTRRTLEREIIGNLENLWRVITQAQGGQEYISKTAMREAPDAEARAQYTPRHASKSASEHVPERQPAPSIIDEPPIVDDDTRPRPAAPVTLTSADFSPESTQQESIKEPDFLSGINEQEDFPTVDESLFQPPQEKPFSIEDFPLPAAPPTPPSTRRVVLPEADEPASTMPIEEPDIFKQAPAQDEPVFTPEPPPVDEAPIFDPVSPVAQTSQVDVPEHSTDENFTLPRMELSDDMDTSQVSVFDLFGLPKPSETQQMKAVSFDTEAETEDVNTSFARPPQAPPSPFVAQSSPMAEISDQIGIVSAPDGSVLGLRVILRRRLTNIRRR